MESENNSGKLFLHISFEKTCEITKMHSSTIVKYIFFYQFSGETNTSDRWPKTYRKTNLPGQDDTRIMAFDQYNATTAHTYWINCWRDKSVLDDSLASKTHYQMENCLNWILSAIASCSIEIFRFLTISIVKEKKVNITTILWNLMIFFC